MVVALDRGKLGEKTAVLRALDVLLERQVALAAAQLEQLVQEAEHLDIAVLLVLRPLEHAPEGFADARQDRLGVAGQ